MKDKKEILKAIDCCVDKDGRFIRNCEDCPYDGLVGLVCVSKLLVKCRDYIKQTK